MIGSPADRTGEVQMMLANASALRRARLGVQVMPGAPPRISKHARYMGGHGLDERHRASGEGRARAPRYSITSSECTSPRSR